MYERLGFRRIPPFEPYTDDPLSRCYEMSLALGCPALFANGQFDHRAGGAAGAGGMGAQSPSGLA
jgi:hypothetical protein